MFSAQNWWAWVGLGLAIVAAVSTSGCGDTEGEARGSVEGTVTVDATPVEQGTISFVPVEGTTGPASYGVIADGKYSLAAGNRGPIVGQHSVQIEAFRDLGKKSVENGQPIHEQVVPAKYNSQTTLFVEITKGQNEHNFDLKTK